LTSPGFQAQQNALLEFIVPATGALLKSATNSRSRTLEIGCGPGQYRLAVNGHYIGTDITTDEYRPGLPRTPDVVADAAALPFKSASFDVVFYSNIFHFLPDPKNALGEAIRTLRTGGCLMLLDYSKLTVERLKAIYENTNQDVCAEPRTCQQWSDLLASAGLCDIRVGINSTAIPYRLAALLNNAITRSAYYAMVDARECSIVIGGRKP
jgi:SAM-dependent methyltransferase